MMAKRLWNWCTAHHRRRDFASSDEIWRDSLPLFLSLRGKRATKCNVLRARCIANLECARYADGLRMLRRAEELQAVDHKRIIKVLLGGACGESDPGAAGRGLRCSTAAASPTAVYFVWFLCPFRI